MSLKAWQKLLEPWTCGDILTGTCTPWPGSKLPPHLDPLVSGHLVLCREAWQPGYHGDDELNNDWLSSSLTSCVNSPLMFPSNKWNRPPQQLSEWTPAQTACRLITTVLLQYYNNTVPLVLQNWFSSTEQFYYFDTTATGSVIQLPYFNTKRYYRSTVLIPARVSQCCWYRLVNLS